MTSLRMGDSTEYLQFEVPERGPDIDPTDDEFPMNIEADLRLGELRAAVLVWRNYATGFADLVAYFGGLERDWRGWSGVRKWESLDHELAIEARHDGHIQVEVQMKRSMWWTASGQLTLEPGEQPSQLAGGLRRALAKA